MEIEIKNGKGDAYFQAWHELKVWPEFFKQLFNNSKKFELRKDDRGFKTGHYLVLREWDPTTEAYTGRVVVRRVTNILRGGLFRLPEGMCIMSLERV